MSIVHDCQCNIFNNGGNFLTAVISVMLKGLGVKPVPVALLNELARYGATIVGCSENSSYNIERALI